MWCNWKKSFAASLVTLAACGLASVAWAGEKGITLPRATTKASGNSLQVAAGQEHKPVHLDAVRSLGGQSSGGPVLIGKLNGDASSNSRSTGPVVNGGGIQGIKIGDLTKGGYAPSRTAPGSQSVNNGKLGTQILGNLGQNHAPGNTKLNVGLAGKLPLTKPIDPGMGAKFQDPFAKCQGGKACKPCKPWNPWCHAWLPWYPCGTWYDPCDPCCHWHPTCTIVYVECVPVYVCDPLFVVEPLVVLPGQPLADLELVDVRQIDEGLAAEKLGPGYRLLVKNNSGVPVTTPFEMTVLATLGETPTEKSPRGKAELAGLAAGQTAVVDVRLPLEAQSLAQSPEGVPLGFRKLVVMLDSRQQIPESSKANNAAALDREKIASVQPRILGFDRPANAGGELVVLGEGFGDQPGTLFLVAGGLKLKLETKGWMTHAVQVSLPELSLAAGDELQFQVLRADGADSLPAAAPATTAE